MIHRGTSAKPRLACLAIAACMFACGSARGESPAADALQWNGWQTFSPRDELRPSFAVNPAGGPTGTGGLVIETGDLPGLDGAWTKTFPITGGSHYRITAYRRVWNLPNPRPHTYVELLFHDPAGKLVPDEQIGVASRPLYAAERPAHAAEESPDDGWTEISGIFRAPAAATHATVKLQLRWQPGARVEWGNVSLKASPPRTPRLVRLAAVNYRPSGGKTTLDNCRQLDPYVAEAARQGADLVVLGECITSVGNGLSAVEAAEPIPGPSTDHFARLAKQHGLHIVTSLHERDGHRVYNTAVLVGPRGEVLGTYRKVCLARDEYRGGVSPGESFPVFDTDIGKVGMMICFDVHMPEAARALAAAGAEIIALPIMGGHPALAKARAIENQIFLVTATYDINDDWMQSGVWDRSGELLTRATEHNSVVVAEVDLAAQYFWRANMGDYQSRLRHERPPITLP